MALIPKQYFVYEEGATVNIPFNVVNNTTQRINSITLTFDEFPEGLEYIANFKDVGTFDIDELTWTIPSLLPGELQTIYILFNTTDLSTTQSITGQIDKAENADYPGESETDFGADVLRHPVGQSFDGYATKELLSIYSSLSSVLQPEAVSGVTYVITASGNCGLELPSVGAIDDGFILGVKIINDNSHTITISTNGAIQIEGNDTEVLTTGDYRKYVLCKSCGGGTWLIM